MEFLIGGVAGMGAGIFTNPMDVVKTRMQLQGELRARNPHGPPPLYRNAPHAFYVIARTDGLRALQSGLLPALLVQLLLNSTRLGLYNVAENKSWTKKQNGDVSVPKSILWSVTSGVAGAVSANPASLVKTQLQSAAHDTIAVGQQHKHRGTWNAFVTIYSRGGVRGLFLGVSSAIPRASIGSGAQLTTFSSSKELLLKNGLFEQSPVALAFAASAISGVFTALVMSPFDVISTRLYNQACDAQGRGLAYTGVLDCLRKTYTTEGLRGFYKGVGPLYMRLAPHTVLSLVFWDKLKFYL